MDTEKISRIADSLDTEGDPKKILLLKSELNSIIDSESNEKRQNSPMLIKHNNLIDLSERKRPASFTWAEYFFFIMFVITPSSLSFIAFSQKTLTLGGRYGETIYAGNKAIFVGWLMALFACWGTTMALRRTKNSDTYKKAIYSFYFSALILHYTLPIIRTAL